MFLVVWGMEIIPPFSQCRRCLAFNSYIANTKDESPYNNDSGSQKPVIEKIHVVCSVQPEQLKNYVRQSAILGALGTFSWVDPTPGAFGELAGRTIYDVQYLGRAVNEAPFFCPQVRK